MNSTIVNKVVKFLQSIVTSGLNNRLRLLDKLGIEEAYFGDIKL